MWGHSRRDAQRLIFRASGHAASLVDLPDAARLELMFRAAGFQDIWSGDKETREAIGIPSMEYWAPIEAGTGQSRKRTCPSRIEPAPFEPRFKIASQNPIKGRYRLSAA